MKKQLVILLTMVMILSLFVGCTSQPVESEEAPVQTVEEAPEAPQAPSSGEVPAADGPVITVNGEEVIATPYPDGGVEDLMSQAGAMGAVALFGEDLAYENIGVFACEAMGSYVVTIGGVSEGDKIAVVQKIAGPGTIAQVFESTVNADGGIEFEGEAGEYVILKAS